MKGDSRLVRVRGLRWVARVLVILAVYFVYCPFLPFAPYLMIVRVLDTDVSRVVYEGVRVSVYGLSLVTAVVLVMLFLGLSKRRGLVEQLVAASLGLQALVVQSTVSLGLHIYSLTWHPIVSGSGFIIVDMVNSVLFVGTLLFFTAALRLSSGQGLGRTIGMHASIVALIGNLFVVALSAYFTNGTLLFENLPGMSLVLALTNFMSIYSLRKTRALPPKTPVKRPELEVTSKPQDLPETVTPARKPLIVLVVFSVLFGLFASVIPSGWSLYALALYGANAYNSPMVYEVFRNAVHVGGLASGVLLAMLLVWKVEKSEGFLKLVAVNCAAQAFAAIASVTFWVQNFHVGYGNSPPGSRGLYLGYVELGILVVGLLLLVSGFMLFADRGRTLALHTTFISFVANVASLFGLLIYGTAGYSNFWGTNLVFAATCGLSIHFLWKPWRGGKRIV